jgi:8-oxo-dGTP pyrophosphatase MutT (NUDIX family)
VWRKATAGEFEVVICGRRSQRLWCLPKGTPDAGESIEDTAVREVQEETGLEVHRGDPLGAIEYWFTANGIRYHKQVHHWLMEPIGGDIEQHDQEFDEVRWIPLADAPQMLTYEGERKVVAEAARILAGTP